MIKNKPVILVPTSILIVLVVGRLEAVALSVGTFFGITRLSQALHKKSRNDDKNKGME